MTTSVHTGIHQPVSASHLCQPSPLSVAIARPVDVLKQWFSNKSMTVTGPSSRSVRRPLHCGLHAAIPGCDKWGTIAFLLLCVCYCTACPTPVIRRHLRVCFAVLNMASILVVLVAQWPTDEILAQRTSEAPENANGRNVCYSCEYDCFELI